jgi:cysteinyl-tRNA synthetase
MKKIASILLGSSFFLCLTCNLASVKNIESNIHKDAIKKMQQFVIGISKFAKKQNPKFIIIPQNGEELIFNSSDTSKEFNLEYIKAIDAIGVEELFYNETFKPNEYRLGILNKIKPEKPIFVADYINDDYSIEEVQIKNLEHNFISFARSKNNYNYNLIPEKIHQENANDINNIKEVKNYLYLINNSNYYSKSKFLEAISNTNYDLILIDLYHNGVQFKKEEIEQLKTKKNGGKRLVLAYMNIGAAENYRNYWNRNWSLGNPSWLKKNYDGYANEIWVEYWNKDWQKIIYGNNNSYVQKIINSGFDGTYLDNVEAYYFLYND